jgi:hypothetical protein
MKPIHIQTGLSSHSERKISGMLPSFKDGPPTAFQGDAPPFSASALKVVCRAWFHNVISDITQS